MLTTDRLNERGPARKLREAINKLSDRVDGLRIASGVGYDVKRTRTGQILKIRGTSETVATELEIQRFQVVTVYSTYLACAKTAQDGNGYGSNLINVLRPYQTYSDDTNSLPIVENSPTLTISQPDEDNTQRRTVSWSYSGEDFTIDQYIHPAYDSSDTISQSAWIYAAKPVTGGTGDDGDGNTIKWIDLNIAGRHWACTELVRVEVCVNNVTKHMYVPASSVGVSA